MKDEQFRVDLESRFSKNEAGMKNDPICEWFYEYYSSENEELRKFVLSFLPSMIFSYLYQLHLKHKTLIGIEAVLLCIYNIEATRRAGNAITWNPSILSLQTVYHRDTPSSSNVRGHKSTSSGDFSKQHFLNSKLTEKNLKTLDKKSPQSQQLVVEPELPCPITYMGGLERENVIKIALQQYIHYINFMPVLSVQSFCKFCINLCNSGSRHEKLDEEIEEVEESAINDNGKEEIKEQNEDNEDEDEEERLLSSLGINKAKEGQSRIPISPLLMQILLDGVLLASHRRKTKNSGEKALNAIIRRAKDELLPEVLLKANALRHILDLDRQQRRKSSKQVQKEEETNTGTVI